MRHQVGDIIRIGKDSMYYRLNTKDNPKYINGSIYEIGLGDSIRVKWDNGETNIYRECDLRLVRRPIIINWNYNPWTETHLENTVF